MIYTTTYSLKRISFLFFLMAFLSVNSIMRAQTPGGVTTGLNLWLDASDGAAVSSNNLTAWTDKTAINTFTVSALPPTVTANAINFHSTVDFNNSTATDVYPGEQSLVGNTAINYTDAYAVFKVNDGNGGVIIGGTIPGSSYGKAVFAEFNSGINSGTGDPVTYSNFPFTDFENYHVFGMDTNIAGNLTGRLDGLDQSVTNSTGFSSINLVPTIGTTNNNGNLEGWNHLKGQIAEVIIYNQSTAGQRINIESYLALKYGINKAGSYVNSSNTIIWNSIANAAYHNDIFGIGQDDISGLNQNIANSMNTGSGDGMGQSGKGNIVISNPSALTNNSFLVIGHDINDFSFVTNNLPASSPQGFMRMNRTWKTQTTGSTGAINLQFDTAAISIPSALNDLKLLIDSDGDGDLTTGIITTVSSASVSGNNIVFENVTFPAGATFPFAKMITSPTGITTGLKLWLDAKSGVTLSTGTQVLQWADKSPSLNNADQGSSANQPILTTNVFNFNPALKLDGVSQYMTLNTIGFSTGIAPRSAFFVASENGNTSAEWIFSYGSNSTNAAWNIGKITGNAELYVSGYSNDAFSSSAFWPIPANSNTPKLGGVIYNGNFASFYSADNSMGTTTKNWNTGVGNGYVGAFISGGEKWKGNIAEILYYSTELSSIDRAIIQSYLAIKYGIHNTGNYFSSANIVIWDATLNAAYHNDVFGIGQDDVSTLNQTTSNSANTGSGDGTGQSGKGNIVISNASLLATNAFLMIGHNTGSLAEIDVNLAGQPTKAVQRLWKVQTTSNPGTVTLSYDKTGLTYSGQIASDYVLLVDPTGTGDFSAGSAVKYPATSISGNRILFNTVDLPNGAVFSFQTFGAPSTQATNVVFANTTTTTSTISWTNGNGSSRAVFILAGSNGSPVPVNNTTYVANTAFGTGTQIGTSGWYCVYNGTGTTVNVSGLIPATNYQVMTVEYNGVSGNELYFSSVSTGNPAEVTTLNNVATLSNLSISEGTLNPVFATGTTSYTATVPNIITSLTLTPTTTDVNATVTVNNVTVTSGSPSGAIALNVGPNIITTVVTAQDGTTIDTYTVTITRTEPTIVTTGTLSALTTIYGTPSASGTFNISGNDMAEGILVTPPVEFEVSADNIAFTNSITIGASGIIPSTPVYIRLKGTIPVGNYSGDIVLTSSNATSVNVATVSSTVTKATLTITTDNQTKTYGSANPALTASYSGFVNGDTATSLTTPPIISTIADATSPVGTYVITASGATSDNYTIVYVDGSLSVTPVVLTITADNQTKTYGSVNPALTASYSGFVNGDTSASLTTQPAITTTADATSPVGTYVITASGATSDNYTFAYVDGSLSVTPVVLTITADNQTKTYGSANPALTASYSGFVNGDTSASLTTPPIISTIADATSPVGTYVITASGATSDNYTFAYVDGTLSVTPVVLTITADNQTKTYGSVNPALTASYSGFVNGDTSASLMTAPTITTTAITGSNIGTYAIIASDAVDPNYTINYVDGNLTITVATLTITADDKTRAFGLANPVLTATYTGFVNGDTVSGLDTAVTISTIANATSPVGVYAITVSGAADTNYSINYVTGVLTVTSSVDANLTSLTINNGVLSPVFSPGTLVYNATVEGGITSEIITAIANDPLATITINGVAISSGTASNPIALQLGLNVIVIKVTAEDGVTTKNYALNITKAGSDIASLSNLSISEGVLKPQFQSDVTSYNTVVKYNVDAIKVTPTVTDPGSKVTVNGLVVANATASAPIMLTAGENTIEIVVTAQDGITKQTYTLVVYKGVSPEDLVVNNILSPNGDGKNDFWEIEDILLYPNNTVTVYDRAGRIVYSKKGYSNEWDGSYSGSPLSNDTYYYLIYFGDDLPKVKGFINMLRD